MHSHSLPPKMPNDELTPSGPRKNNLLSSSPSFVVIKVLTHTRDVEVVL